MGNVVNPFSTAAESVATPTTVQPSVSAFKKLDPRRTTRGLFNTVRINAKETVRMQLLSTEVHEVHVHKCSINGRYDKEVCQKGVNQDGTVSTNCIICNANTRPSEQHVFEVLEFRGKYDKDIKGHLPYTGVPLQTYFMLNRTEYNNFKDFCDLTGKNPMSIVFDVRAQVTQTNNGVTYSYSRSVDEQSPDVFIPTPLLDLSKFKRELPPVKQAFFPPSDSELFGVQLGPYNK